MGQVTIDAQKKLWFLIKNDLSQRKGKHEESLDSFIETRIKYDKKDDEYFILPVNLAALINICGETEKSKTSVDCISKKLSIKIAEKCDFDASWSEWTTGTCEAFETKYIEHREMQLYLQKKLWFLIRDVTVRDVLGHTPYINPFCGYKNEKRAEADTQFDSTGLTETSGISLNEEPKRYDLPPKMNEKIAKYCGFPLDWTVWKTGKPEEFETAYLALLDSQKCENRKTDQKLAKAQATTTNHNEMLASLSIKLGNVPNTFKWSLSFTLNCQAARLGDFKVFIPYGYLQLDVGDCPIITPSSDDNIDLKNKSGQAVKINPPGGFKHRRTWYVEAVDKTKPIGDFDSPVPFCEISNLAADDKINFRFAIMRTSLEYITSQDTKDSDSEVSQVKKDLYKLITEKENLKPLPGQPEENGWVIICEASETFIAKAANEEGTEND